MLDLYWYRQWAFQSVGLGWSFPGFISFYVRGKGAIEKGKGIPMSTSVINAVFNHFKFFDKLNHFNLTRELAHMTHKKWDKNVIFFFG